MFQYLQSFLEQCKLLQTEVIYINIHSIALLVLLRTCTGYGKLLLLVKKFEFNQTFAHTIQLSSSVVQVRYYKSQIKYRRIKITAVYCVKNQLYISWLVHVFGWG